MLGPLVTFGAIALCGNNLTSVGNSLSLFTVWFPDFALHLNPLENFRSHDTWCHVLQILGTGARHYFLFFIFFKGS